MKKVTVTADRFTELKNVRRVIKSVKNAPFHVACITTDYTLFKERKGNRDGLQEDRVKNFIKKIEANCFYPILGMIFIDKDGIIIDGHHRFNALKRTNKPVVFMVLSEELTLNEVSDFNTNKSSSWKNKDNFGSACDTGAELALQLNKLRIGLVSKYSKDGITAKEINIGDMYAILTQDSKYFGGGYKSITRKMFEDNTYLDVSQTIEYAEKLEMYTKIKATLINAQKRYKITKVVMQCTFPENMKVVNFSLNHFIENLTAFNFKYQNDGLTDNFVKEAVRIHNIRRPKNQRAIELS